MKRKPLLELLEDRLTPSIDFPVVEPILLGPPIPGLPGDPADPC
ncbi:MAG: hypothetical protein NZO58_04515 [Gemmataceae bacterium]|nr:hypothetical protein [Gemmataceae bacterium]